MALPELSDQDRNWYILKGYEIIEGDGLRIWFLNKKFHRENGPAVEFANGSKYFFIHGKKIG